MKTQIITPTTSHNTYFNAFIEKLAAKFEPLQIFNFSHNSFAQHNQGCFKQEAHSHYSNYCLLLVTESATRIDHEVQDFANTAFKQGQITVICHCQKSIEEAIAANNRFFITMYNKAELLYSHNGMLLLQEVAAFNPAHEAAKAQKHYDHRFPLAQGFYLGANECISNWEQYSVAVFMLHQAVEQLCIGLIRVQTGYRSEFHNLHRLLRLCTCFSNAPYELFLATDDDRRLFDILAKSYSSARYKTDFKVSEQDANCLCDKVSDFIDLTAELCEGKIAALERESISYGQKEFEGCEA